MTQDKGVGKRSVRQLPGVNPAQVVLNLRRFEE